MFLYVLLAVVESHKTICICNGKCDPQCPKDYYNALSTNVSFTDFIYTILDNEQQITLDFYSQRSNFVFPLDPTKFGTVQIILRALSNSEAVQIEIKQESKKIPRTIKIEPNYQVILPNLISIPIPNINKAKKNTLSSNTPSIIPISVTIPKMKHYGSGKCNKKTSNGNADFDFDDNTQININDIYCDYTNLDTSAAYNCGIRCWGSNLNYSYTFKGEKFEIYGTKCAGNFDFDVELDGKIIASPNEYLDGTKREERVIVYSSPIFEYNEHTVRILSKGKTYEFYKLTYYPSVKAKRINSTQFNKVGSNWKAETDGIGGVRHYRENNGGQASIKLNCMKFWLYGLNDNNLGLIDISYGTTTTQVNPQCPHAERREGALLYESPELSTFDITLSLSVSSQTMFIYCLYYIEPPTPLSVALFQMTYSSIDNCAYYNKDGLFDINSVSSSTSQNINCPKTDSADLSAESTYKCGIKCWGKSTYSYKFKGVKFALYGTFNSGHGSFIVYLDNSELSRVDQSIKTISGPSLLYESPRLIYKEHEIRIQSNKDKVFEFYKLIYWPSLRVNRANCTQFDYNTFSYNFESDGIGGLRKSIFESNYFTFVDIPITCSRFWFYSVKDRVDASYKEVRFRFANIIDEEITSYTMAGRTENALLYESRELAFTSGSLTISTKYALIVNCLYYTYAPSIAEYINKTFSVTLPYFNIYVPGNSVTSQISGCTFNSIQEENDFIIRLEKEVSFFDNIFDYPLTGSEKCTIRANYNGNLRIKNCTFTNAKCKSNQQGNVFYSSNSINIFFESCKFNNCGNSKDQVIIKIDGSGSSLFLENCSISFIESIEPARVIDSKCLNIKINGSKFERTAGNVFNGEWRDSATGKISIINSIFNACKTSGNPNSFMRFNFNIEFSFEFENNTISNFNIDSPFSSILSINARDYLNKFEFQNITFEHNTCSCLYGGGAGIFINDTSEVSFYNCHFKNNKAKQSSQSRSSNLIGLNQPYLNGDGGGIQLGFICHSNDFAVKFDNCEFTNNLAYRHGGAIAIQTLGTVVITNCIFKGNEANSRFDSSELLVENHFHKKFEGRGGAIYINPSYYYTYQNAGSVLIECSNTNDFMKSVSIQGCEFIENKAYDGYGIYIEGDDMGTKFDIKQNTFTDNNKPNPNDTSDPNITIRGDILTEIHTITDEVTRQNTFSESNHKKLIYIDHYGYRIPTFAFTESGVFSYSDAFSCSGHFSPSSYFSESGKFSKSDLFSKSNDFTKSDAFSETKGFTKSDAFSETKGFTKSNAFSKTKGFTKTNAFTETKGFTKTNAFTETKGFSKSDAFVETKRFTKSNAFSETKGFTKTNAFTETKGFTKTNAFTETKGFSKSDAFIETKEFTKSDAFSETKAFTKSGAFGETKGFTKTNAFTETKGFTKSDAFIETKGFTKSDAFGETKGFSKSNAFTETKAFSKSDAFIETKKFTKTNAFTETKGFTKSSAFSETKGFTKTNAFTETKGFSKSDAFIETKGFSKSSAFTDTQGFSKTSVFSETKGFTKTNAFTETKGFSKSDAFIETKRFSKSSAFSETKGFTKSDAFSATKGFTKTNVFTGTKGFSQSQIFTNSFEIGRSLYFTPSKPFSNSFLFSNSYVFSKSDQFSQTQDISKLIFIDPSSNKESSREIPSIIPSNSKSIIDDGDPSVSSKSGKHSIIPIVVGVVIGILVLIAIIVLIIIFVIRRRRNKEQSDDKTIEVNSTQFEVSVSQNQEFENVLYEKPEIDQDPFDRAFDEDI